MTENPGQIDTSGSQAETEQIAGDSIAVSGWTMVSRITGFGRFVAIAAVLGPTYFGNLFAATNVLPNLAFELLTGPLIVAILVPSLVKQIDVAKHGSVSHLANGFLGVLTVVFSGAVLLVVAAGPIVLGLLTILVPDSSIRAGQLDAGWPLLAMLMPQAVFYALASTGVAVQNSHHKFRLAAAAPAFENIGIMAVMGISAAVYGLGVEVGEVSTGQLLLLGLGTTASVGLHAGIQWWGARRVGVTLIPKAGWRDPDVKKMMRLAIPSTGYATLNGARFIGLLTVAGSIPGGVIAIQLGRYFFNLPVALAARPVMTAQLPRLSRAFNDNDDRRFLTTYRNGIRLILFVVVPASLFLTALAMPMARAVAYGEMATSVGITLAAVAIGTLAPGIVGESLFLAATSACYSRDNATTPLKAMAARVFLTVIGITIAVLVGEGVMVLAILGLSVAAADLISGIGLHWALQRSVPAERQAIAAAEWVANFLVAALAVAVGAGFVALAGFASAPGRFTEAALGAGITILVYLSLQRLRHSPELDELATAFRRTGNA